MINKNKHGNKFMINFFLIKFVETFFECKQHGLSAKRLT